uniref:Uncharacterized protein n=1 Tax=Acrobeloides nanus TaxID=290746 RepID=A0A914DH01_9BILA
MKTDVSAVIKHVAVYDVIKAFLLDMILYILEKTFSLLHYAAHVNPKSIVLSAKEFSLLSVRMEDVIGVTKKVALLVAGALEALSSGTGLRPGTSMDGQI